MLVAMRETHKGKRALFVLQTPNLDQGHMGARFRESQILILLAKAVSAGFPPTHNDCHMICQPGFLTGTVGCQHS